VGYDYEVVVKPEGYENAHEAVAVPNIAGATASVIVFLKLVNETLAFRALTGQFVLTPRAQKEVQLALQDLRSWMHLLGRLSGSWRVLISDSADIKIRGSRRSERLIRGKKELVRSCSFWHKR
jgi:hypothetical protein